MGPCQARRVSQSPLATSNGGVNDRLIHRDALSVSVPLQGLRSLAPLSAGMKSLAVQYKTVLGRDISQPVPAVQIHEQAFIEARLPSSRIEALLWSTWGGD